MHEKWYEQAQKGKVCKTQGIQNITYNIWILIGYCLWVYIILIGIGEYRVCENLTGIGEPI